MLHLRRHRPCRAGWWTLPRRRSSSAQTTPTGPVILLALNSFGHLVFSRLYQDSSRRARHALSVQREHPMQRGKPEVERALTA